MLRLPPPIWMFLFLIAAGLISYLSPFAPALRVLPLGVALILGGIALAVSAVVRFRAAGTEIDPMSMTNKALIVSGPYRFTRNPMYLSLVMFSLGIAIAVGTWPMFAVPVLVFVIAATGHIPFEEAKMHRQFGADWDNYCSRVRRWI